MIRDLTENSVLVYLESAPVGPNVVAHGLYRAAVPIIKSIYEDVEVIGILPIDKWFSSDEFDPVIGHSCKSLGRWATILFKIGRRNRLIKYLAVRITGRALALRLHSSQAKVILALVGTDSGTLERTAELARILKLPYALYIVDDFVTPMRLAGKSSKEINSLVQKIKRTLDRSSKIFAITAGLADLINSKYSAKAEVLHLPFEKQNRPNQPVKRQIFYLGSINFLYAQGLKDLFKIVENIRVTTGGDITIRLTADLKIAARELGSVPAFVQAQPISGAMELAREIAASVFAFLPYSFDPNHHDMVTTSFPSKCMEYFAFARSIVVYGPEYGTSTKYFREMNLPTVCTSIEDLEGTVVSLLSMQPDSGDKYAAVLEKSHSIQSARQTLRDGLHGPQELSS